MVAPEAYKSKDKLSVPNSISTPGGPYQNAHEGDDEVNRAMRPDHDNVAIGDAGLVEMPCQRVGGFIDLLVGKAPLGGGRGLGLDNACSLRMRLGLATKVLLDRADVARPIEVYSGVWYLGHGLVRFGCEGMVCEGGWHQISRLDVAIQRATWHAIAPEGPAVTNFFPTSDSTPGFGAVPTPDGGVNAKRRCGASLAPPPHFVIHVALDLGPLTRRSKHLKLIGISNPEWWKVFVTGMELKTHGRIMRLHLDKIPCRGEEHVTSIHVEELLGEPSNTRTNTGTLGIGER